MKNKIILAILFIPLFISCSNDSDEPQTISQESTQLLITASQGKATSRVGFADDGAVVNWASGDKFTVFGESDKQIFTLKSGENTPKGIFEGTQPTGDGPYPAFYPEAKAGETYNDCILDATGQSQAINGDMTHLAAYTYMTGNVTLGAEGEAKVGFSHQMVMMKFEFTLPTLADGEVLKKLIVSTNKTNKTNVIYLKKGLTDNSLDEKSEEQELDITGITPDGNTLTAYMMMVPFSLVEGDKLILTVETKLPADPDRREENRTDDNDEFYRARFYDKIVTIGAGGKTYEAGKKYTATVSLAPVAYDRGDGTYSYPVKLTNTTTKKSYYIVSPLADWNGKVTKDAVNAYMNDDWKMLDSKKEPLVPTYITIQEILNNTTLSSTAQEPPTDVIGFDEVFPADNADRWLYTGEETFYVMYSKKIGIAGPLNSECIIRLVRQ